MGTSATPRRDRSIPYPSGRRARTSIPTEPRSVTRSPSLNATSAMPCSTPADGHRGHELTAFGEEVVEAVRVLADRGGP